MQNWFVKMLFPLMDKAIEYGIHISIEEVNKMPQMVGRHIPVDLFSKTDVERLVAAILVRVKKEFGA